MVVGVVTARERGVVVSVLVMEVVAVDVVHAALRNKKRQSGHLVAPRPGQSQSFKTDRDGALLGYKSREASVKKLPSDLGGHSDPGGRWPPGPPTTGAPPTGWGCSHEHSDRGGSAAVRSGKSAGSRRLTAARGNPSWRRSALRRHEDSDSP
ncbi:hypothetical protein NDU88_006599 [Pleurodeles waltl]|uniref:Uncharacterized protein n=1 Tax=Pleurodeles waltl TaxID=8319 RepID=A0AAV7X145_PLEWA|nr:hypothetical protein NDU88_006599 [Pleurodeles waltl]